MLNIRICEIFPFLRNIGPYDLITVLEVEIRQRTFIKTEWAIKDIVCAVD